MKPSTIVRRIAVVVGAIAAAGVAMTLVRARGRRPPEPDASTWHQVS